MVLKITVLDWSPERFIMIIYWIALQQILSDSSLSRNTFLGSFAPKLLRNFVQCREGKVTSKRNFLIFVVRCVSFYLLLTFSKKWFSRSENLNPACTNTFSKELEMLCGIFCS
jgi:hypothetical protein